VLRARLRSGHVGIGIGWHWRDIAISNIVYGVWHTQRGSRGSRILRKSRLIVVLAFRAEKGGGATYAIALRLRWDRRRT